MDNSITASTEAAVPTGLRKTERSRWRQWSKGKYLLLLFFPTFVYYVVFKYAPMFGLVISFKNYNLFKGIWASEWVGLKYYMMFFQNLDFFKLLRNTIMLGVYKLVFGFPAPIILALLLNELRHAVFKRFVQTVSYLPHFISNVVTASMVLMFLSPSSGIVNHLLQALGFNAINFMAMPDPKYGSMSAGRRLFIWRR